MRLITTSTRRSGASTRRIALGGLLVLALVAAWVLSASQPGAKVEGCPEGCATALVRREGPLRVLSLNMLHGFPRFERLEERLELIAAEIRHQDADIVLLQEVPWTLRLGSGARYLAQHTGLNYLYLRANGNRWAILFEEGEAILSRYALQDPDFVELEPRAGFFQHRVALQATVLTPWGDLPVVVTHLTHGDPKINQAQGQSLMSFDSGASLGRTLPGPAVVAGDLNAEESSPQIRAIAQVWVDAHQAGSPDAPGPTCCVDNLTAGPDEPIEKRIDYLFLVPGPSAPPSRARIVSSQRVLDQPHQTEDGWLWASDHVGLLVEIELRP